MSVTLVKCKMENFGYLAIVLFAVFNVVEVAMVTVDNDKTIFNYAYKSANPLRSSDEDLTYSDFETVMDKREDFYRKLRDFGVPSDVVNQMYPQRGMTIGDLTGHNSNHEHHSSGDDDTDVTTSTFDPWTIVWYIGSFGGLIAFFLVVSCSEWCCLRNRQQNRQEQTAQGQTACPAGVERVRATSRSGCETPPPSYHLFAPPSYDSINYEEKTEKYDIFVVPVHAVRAGFANAAPVRNGGVGEQVPPPEYSTVTMPT